MALVFTNEASTSHLYPCGNPRSRSECSVLATTMITRGALLWTTVCLAACSAPTISPDAEFSTYVESLQAIDNHSHVVTDPERDRGFDALPCDQTPIAPGMPPANLRFGPELQGAWKGLYDFQGSSDAPEQLAGWQAARARTRSKAGAGYFDSVAERVGLDIVLANRISMTPELGARRFRWVSYDDALIFPLNNTHAKAESPDRQVFYANEERILETYMTDLGMTRLPASLDEYVAAVVAPTLEAQKNQGAVAIKFEAAYLRSLDFEPASHDDAEAAYAKYAPGGAPAQTEYRQLQDYLFRRVVAQAGGLGLAVHIHTGGGCGSFFDDRGADPTLLSSVFNDPALRQTNFVLLHGGYPFDRHVASLLNKPNVYVDFSALDLLLSSAELARVIRPWLEVMPEHVLFGTDAGPWAAGMNWEESAWIATRRARRAIVLALSEMARDGVVTMERARVIANGVLRQNAIDLYKLLRPESSPPARAAGRAP